MLIGIALSLDPERAVLMEELDVHGLVTHPGAVLQSIAAHAHHTDGVGIVPEEIGIRLHETGGQNAGRIHHHGQNHRRLEQADRHRVGQARRGRLVAIQGVIDLHARRGGKVQGEGRRVVSGRFAHQWHRRIAFEHGRRSACVCGVRRRVGADFPSSRSVGFPGPAVVLLVRGDVRAVGVALDHGAGGVRQHDRFLLALMNPEVGVEETARIQVARLGLAAAHDDQVAIRRDDSPGRNRKLGGVVQVVGQVPSSQVHSRPGLIEELDEILVVARNVERVVRTGEFVDDHLRRQGDHGQPHQGQEEGQVSVQFQGFAMYAEGTPQTAQGCTDGCTFP